MDFDSRLQKAIQRGSKTRSEQGQAARQSEANEDELRQLHSKYRIDLSDHIGACLTKVADHFPGFEFTTLVSEDGWGARIQRDDIDVRARQNMYSRFEMVVQPFSSARILAINAKGTIRNKEVLNRSHFQFLTEPDIDSFSELIDLWVLEYAEKFSAGN